MRQFKFTRASSEDQVVTNWSPKASLIAGGTCVVDLMKLNVMQPAEVIDINRIALKQIEDKGDSVRIGALVTNSNVAHNDLIKREFPALSAAILSGASPQLRNMATIGGNLMQKTRCYYYRDVKMPCNKREPGSGCPAIEGFNRIHAVLGTSKSCIATHPSDMCVALAALDARINITGPKGTRVVKAVDFHRLPGDTPHIETDLRPGEIITSVDLEKSELAKNSVYLKVRDRSTFSFALVSAAVALTKKNGKVVDVRVAMGGVATRPWRSTAAEKILKGKKADRTSYHQAADAALAEALAHKHNKFKISLAKKILERALNKAEMKA